MCSLNSLITTGFIQSIFLLKIIISQLVENGPPNFKAYIKFYSWLVLKALVTVLMSHIRVPGFDAYFWVLTSFSH